jgi:hypothetical protein
MLHMWLALALVLLNPAHAASGPLETINTSEFLQLSEDLQTIYVAGVLDGMSYVSYNDDIAIPDKWIACVRTQALKKTVADVVQFLRDNPEEAFNPVPWSISKAISQLPCEHWKEH